MPKNILLKTEDKSKNFISRPQRKEHIWNKKNKKENYFLKPRIEWYLLAMKEKKKELEYVVGDRRMKCLILVSQISKMILSQHKFHLIPSIEEAMIQKL